MRITSSIVTVLDKFVKVLIRNHAYWVFWVFLLNRLLFVLKYKVNLDYVTFCRLWVIISKLLYIVITLCCKKKKIFCVP